MLKEKLQKFLADHYKLQDYEVKEFLDHIESFYLLLIWGIFEQKYFPGKNADIFGSIKKMENNFTDDCYYNDFNNIVLSLHDTFQDNTRWEKLDNEILSKKEKFEVFTNICNKKKEELSDIEKIRFGLFIVYRYRNNIFHGLKEANNYKLYTKEIGNCVELLIAYMKGVK